MAKPKYYVVWRGVRPGIYTSWDSCKAQVFGFEGARYKSFKTIEEANAAYSSGIPSSTSSEKRIITSEPQSKSQVAIIEESLSVDAACSGNPGVMEYRGVYVKTGEEWFLKSFPMGTNNIGEFLAIVHGLAELKRQNLNIPIYTDSVIAMGWIKKRVCATKLERNSQTASLFEVIARAERWLQANSWSQPLLKWDTKKWGEIPADFGRK